MKRLTLLRHAKAEAYDSRGDHKRALSRRGITDALLVGEFLYESNLSPHRFLVSDAKRTAQTAELVAQANKLREDVIEYDAKLYVGYSVVDFLKRMATISDVHKHVAIVGHNPWISDMASEFVSGFYDNLPTTGCLLIDFEINSWQELSTGMGEIHSYVSPKTLI